LGGVFLHDQEYMDLALELAEKGCGWVNPNPMVGAVIVKDNRIIGQGYHQRYGEFHAERNALASCKEDPRGATLYVTLEPCCHHGKTPPCTEAIIESGIARVVIASPDPNPLVAGEGVRILREHGVQVEEGLLREACDKLNKVFFHFIQTKTPYVVMKYAMTMDGKIATASGLSQWITGEVARSRVHTDRHRYQAIMVGVGTVLADDPLLTCRLPNGRNPIRVICDTHLRTPLDAQVVTTTESAATILATCCKDPARVHMVAQLPNLP
jgi:diaminohydroxyphosphoribosylaminopyrimidine deaminase/5-amino-6-(5-phosphoribosylamino)uracil reductase